MGIQYLLCKRLILRHPDMFLRWDALLRCFQWIRILEWPRNYPRKDYFSDTWITHNIGVWETATYVPFPKFLSYILHFILLGFTYSVACKLLSCKVVRQLKIFCPGFSGRICIYCPGFSGRICIYCPGFSGRICIYCPGFSGRICSYLPGFSCRNFSGMRKCKKSPSRDQKAGMFRPYL